MKQLYALVVILVVVGIGGFLYRNALERPIVIGGKNTACTMEAKLCPDGTSVGRSGPDCAFAACALPNAEDTAIGIAFVIPAGYTANTDAIGADESLRAVFDKAATGAVPHSIVIRRFEIPAGETAESVILAHTMFEPSGSTPTSLADFKTVTIGSHTYQFVVLERFEGQVHSAYYLVRDTDVLRFEILEKDVDWTNPDLVITELPEHKALRSLLATLQSR